MEHYNVSSLDTTKFDEEYFSQENICRLCWKEGAMKDFFESKDGIEIIEMTAVCLDLVLPTVTQPNKLCQRCYDSIIFFYNFKNFCQTSTKKLLELQLKQFNRKPKVEMKNLCSDKIYNKTNFIESIQKNKRSSNFILQTNIKIEPLSDSDNTDFLNQDTLQKVRKSIKKQSNMAVLDQKTTAILYKHYARRHSKANGNLKCFGCTLHFKSWVARLNHEKECKALSKGYLCTECNNYYPKRKLYEYHVNKNHRKGNINLPSYYLKCKFCDQQFDDKHSYTEHVQTHEVKKKNFVCEVCGRAFVKKNYLQAHMTTHTGEKNFKCTYCEYATNTVTTLIMHTRKHTGERPYSCDLCPQKCISSSNLRAHRLRHFGIKKFECKVCDKKFAYKDSLSRHIASIHESHTHAYPCELCGKTFHHNSALRKHVRRTHMGKKD